MATPRFEPTKTNSGFTLSIVLSFIGQGHWGRYLQEYIKRNKFIQTSQRKTVL